MPCCKCNGNGARCKGCSCAKGKKAASTATQEEKVSVLITRRLGLQHLKHRRSRRSISFRLHAHPLRRLNSLSCLRLPFLQSIIHFPIYHSHFAHRSQQQSLPAYPLVSSPDPYSQQLRVDYITATWKVGLGNKNDALVPSVLQCLCPKIVRQSKFRTNLAQLERNKRYHFRMILLRVLSIVAFGRAASEDWVCSPLPFSGRVLQN